MNFIIRTGCIFFFKQYFMVSFGQDNIGMCISYFTDADSCSGDNLCPCIKLGLLVIDHNHHMMSFCQVYCFFRYRFIYIFQQLEALFWIAKASAQCSGILESNPVKARNAYTHSVFIYPWIYLNFNRNDLSAYSVISVCRGKGHTYRLCTSQSRNYLLVK